MRCVIFIQKIVSACNLKVFWELACIRANKLLLTVLRSKVVIWVVV